MCREGFSVLSGSNHRYVVLFAVSLVLVIASACSKREIDRSNPEQVYTGYLNAVESDRFQDVYPIIVRELRTMIEESFYAMKETKTLIEDHYAHNLKRAALAEIGSVEIRESKTPSEYFGRLVAEERKSVTSGMLKMSLFDSMKLKFKFHREVPAGSGRYLVSLQSGEDVEFITGSDGYLYLVPNHKDANKIKDLHTKSLNRLDVVRRVVGKLRGQTGNVE